MSVEGTYILKDSDNHLSLFLEKFNLVIPFDQELLNSEYCDLNELQRKELDNYYNNNADEYVYRPLKGIDAEEVIHLLYCSELFCNYTGLSTAYRYFTVGADSKYVTGSNVYIKLIYDKETKDFVQVGVQFSKSFYSSHFLKVEYINHFNNHDQYINDLKKRNYDIISYKEAGIIMKPKQEDRISYLLNCDARRCGLKAYSPKILEDINLGHWDVEPGDQRFVYRDPVKDIKKNGIIGIDFGTKSTVVVKQEGTNIITPIRIASLSLSTDVRDEDFENPTIISCMNLDTFIHAYSQKAGRPETSCEDFFVSYNALNDFCHCPSDQFYSYYSDLKQWANSEKKSVLVQDKNKVVYNLDNECSVDNKTLNPIELYAYYIGMYINNMLNGIYLRYIMSFPVKFSKNTRELIRKSFEKGIKKSIPESIVSNAEIMSKFSVKYELSEPAAYAVTALELSNLNPEDENDKYLYGVFDFGGGTTDFDFGVWRGASDEEYDKYNCDYVLECFGADTDPYLGGENILEMLAYHVFKKNKVMAESNRLVCACPNNETVFSGGEYIVNNSKEANRNLIILKEAFRPLWEQHDGWERIYNNENSDENKKESINLQLVNCEGELTPNCNFDVDTRELIELIKSRIKQGVDSFFNCFENIMLNNDKAKFSEQLHIFLAGNSCKSVFVKDTFNDKIKTLEDDYLKKRIELLREGNSVTGDITDEHNQIFIVHAPISNEDHDIYKPNGKTGVAYGLVKSRSGGKILVIKNNENDSEAETKFKFYLGTERRNKFECKLRPVEYDTDGKPQSVYGKWIRFQGAGIGIARIYYTEDSRADTKGTTKLSIDNIPFAEISFDSDENKYLFIKAVGPCTIECAIAESEQHITCSCQTVVIGNS